ncbi:serine/threonine-protein kinase pim-1-like [Tachysurus ichikawai]
MFSQPVRCPNILELLECFVVQNYLVLILEDPSPGMDLLDFCELHRGKLPEPLARNIMVQGTPCNYCPGTKQYFPPEWCKENLYMGHPTTIWTLGVLLYTMLCGKLPFETLEEIIAGHLHFPPDLSKDCQKFILRCLAQKPKSRPSFKQLLKNRW